MQLILRWFSLSGRKGFFPALSCLIFVTFSEAKAQDTTILPVPVPADTTAISDTSSSASDTSGILIEGMILNANAGAQPEINVFEKGTLNGTTSDSSGNFSLRVKDSSSIITFSGIGFETVEYVVSSRSDWTIVVAATGQTLQDVVVVGYGSQRRRDVTGAVSSLSSKDIHEVPTNNVLQSLQGRAAGVYVGRTSARPGAGANILIRGQRSFNAGNDPLYVVDGIPFAGGLNDLPVDNIASLEVLKDASATAIYGSRGANGVVIITTRRGTGGTGGAEVSYNSWVRQTRVIRTPQLLNSTEFAEFKREARRSIGTYDDNDPVTSDRNLFQPEELEGISDGTNTDYLDLMLQHGWAQNHDLGIRGGNENTKFSISLNYFNETGIIPTMDFTRYSAQINLDHNISDRIRTGISMLASHTETNGADQNPYLLALTANPLGKPYDVNGNLVFFPVTDGVMTNPLMEIQPGNIANRLKRIRIFSNLFAEAEILDGLTYRMNFGPDLTQSNTDNFRNSQTRERSGGTPSASKSSLTSVAYTWENILTYNKDLGEKHRINVTGLYSLQSFTSEATNANVQNLPVPDLEYNNLGQAGTITGVGSGYTDWAIESYMARINYAFDERFLLTLTGRADGSSKFGPGNKWGYFPSAAIGWNIANEAFMADSKLFSLLKLRASYGSTGNAEIPPYQTRGLLARTPYDFDGSPAFGYRPSTLGNPALQWETTTNANAGVDFGILDDRISGSVELYETRTSDLLLTRLVPATTGFQEVIFNVGETRNQGLEITLNTRIIEPKTETGFSWESNLTLANNREEIVSLSQGKTDDVGNARFIGEQLRVFYDYEKAGIWQTNDPELAAYNAQAGQIKVNDNNRDGRIDGQDRAVLGNVNPRWQGGWSNRFGFRRFDFSFFFTGRTGNTITSGIHTGQILNLTGQFNNLKVDYWTPANPTNAYPRPTANQNQILYGSTLSYFNGSFLRMRNMSLGYTFNPERLQNARISNLRVYANVENPFIFSEYVHQHGGMDPEVTDFPATATFLLGVNISF